MAGAPRLRLLACMCQRSRLIGLRGDLPWKLAPDLAHVRGLLAEDPGAAILGRATFEEALRTHPHGLPCRPVAVLSSAPGAALRAAAVGRGDVFLATSWREAWVRLGGSAHGVLYGRSLKGSLKGSPRQIPSFGKPCRRPRTSLRRRRVPHLVDGEADRNGLHAPGCGRARNCTASAAPSGCRASGCQAWGDCQRPICEAPERSTSYANAAGTRAPAQLRMAVAGK